MSQNYEGVVRLANQLAEIEAETTYDEDMGEAIAYSHGCGWSLCVKDGTTLPIAAMWRHMTECLGGSNG